MARIVKFEVKGLAGREDVVSRRLEEDVNVFFGINGSGKTTLLKILHSALSTDTSILNGLAFTSAEVDIYLNRHKAVFTRRLEQGVTAQETGGEAKEFPSGYRQVSALGGAPEKRFRWMSNPEEPNTPRLGLTSYSSGYLPITRLYRAVGTQSSGVRTMSEEELDAQFASQVRRRWTEYQAEVATSISEAQGEGLAKIFHLVLSGEEEEATETDDSSVEISNAYERVAAFLGRQEGFEAVLDSKEVFEEKYRTQPRIKTIVKQIDLVEKKIERVNVPRNHFKSLLESMYSGNKKISFSEKDIAIEVSGKTPIRLPSLSSGEKQLFLIALEAIQSGNSSLIIDEPELSMHVDWQKKLVVALHELNPRMQLIMATHSPEIMADLPDEKVFSL
jgi:predicted ATPase